MVIEDITTWIKGAITKKGAVVLSKVGNEYVVEVCYGNGFKKQFDACYVTKFNNFEDAEEFFREKSHEI